MNGHGKIGALHQGIVITYDETADKWNFTLRGRERNVDTLRAAREAIDAPPPKEKKPFERIECLTIDRYGEGKFEKVTVTSIAAKGPYSYCTQEVWISKGEDSHSRKKREKRDASRCYPATHYNLELASQFESLAKEEAKLAAKRNTIFEKMQPLVIENE